MNELKLTVNPQHKRLVRQNKEISQSNYANWDTEKTKRGKIKHERYRTNNYSKNKACADGKPKKQQRCNRKNNMYWKNKKYKKD